MEVKIVNGTVVTAAETRPVEVGIEGGRIAAIAPKIPGPARETIDATGCLVLPGCVEAHRAPAFSTARKAPAHGRWKDVEGPE